MVCVCAHLFWLSSRKAYMSQSFLVAISRRRPWNLCCHSAQCARMAPLMGEQSSKTNSLLTSVSSFWTLLAISEYLRREGRERGGEGEGRGGEGEEE